MIKSVTVTNHRGESLKMELASPEKSGFAITHIEGLTPPSSTINTTELVTNDGAVFNSVRLESRNIVLTFCYYGTNNPIEKLRELSYTYFAVKKKITLTFETDYRYCSIDGYVETHEADIFVSQCAAQVSIVCPNPYFYTEEINTTKYVGTDDEFEFPLAVAFSENDTYELNQLCIYNNSIYRCIHEITVPGPFNNYHWSIDPDLQDGDLGQLEFPINDPIPISILNKSTIRNVHYDGEIDVGIMIHIHVNLAPVRNIHIWNYYTEERIDIDTDKVAKIVGGDLQENDDIYISTLSGSKYINLVRNGRTYNILNAINKNAAWFQLTLGDNTFCYNADIGTYDFTFTIENRTIIQGL